MIESICNRAIGLPNRAFLIAATRIPEGAQALQEYNEPQCMIKLTAA